MQGTFLLLFAIFYYHLLLTYGSIRDHHGVWEEESQQGIENIQVPEEGTHKILIDGTIYIIRDKAIYNLQGARVR